MKNILCLAVILKFCVLITAQNTVNFIVLDDSNQQELIGVNIYLKTLDIGTTTDENGKAQLSQIPAGKHTFAFSYLGYETKSADYLIERSSPVYTIELTPSSQELDEVIVTSNRANRSVANIPSRIEVLTDEVEEAATMDPSKIAHLLMHTTGIQVQQQSATSGTSSVRIQGLYGRYTQILKDGFPIYGGFTGGLGVLQIPPLDLRQVEFVKGSASTLYGGGAIGGLINLIPKELKDNPEASLHLNQSHIGNTDLNAFFSTKSGNWGMTIFTSNNTNTVYDVDQDGFSDVPEVRKFNFNPKVFFYLNDKTTISLGGTFTNENRIGGDVILVEGGKLDSIHSYFERNKSKQTSTLFKIEHELSKTQKIEFKNSTNNFDRNIFLNDYAFAGTQFSTFTELSYSLNNTTSNLILGINLYSDSFDEKEIETSLLRDQRLLTIGAFAQYIYDVNPKLSVEAGLRSDYNTDYGNFILPKVALVYKPSLRFTGRLGGGLGYKLPTIFTEDAEILAFQNVNPVDPNTHSAEESFGLNADLTYRFIVSDNFSLSLTEYLFYNKLDAPLILEPVTMDESSFRNSDGYFETKGIETLIKASLHNFNLYLGYTYVDASRTDSAESLTLPLTPTHSFHGDLMFIVDVKWRCGLDAEYESEQTLNSGRVVQALFKAGFLAERMFEKYAIYINLENWTDTRQSNYETIVQAPFTNPRFTEVWAPLDGFIFNAGVKVRL